MAIPPQIKSSALFTLFLCAVFFQLGVKRCDDEGDEELSLTEKAGKAETPEAPDLDLSQKVETPNSDSAAALLDKAKLPEDLKLPQEGDMEKAAKELLQQAAGKKSDEKKDGESSQKSEEESNAESPKESEEQADENAGKGDEAADTDGGEGEDTEEEIDPGIDVFLIDPKDADEARELLEYGDLYEFSAYISRWKKKPIIVDSRILDIEATVHLPPKASSIEVQVALLSLLRMNGFTLIDVGDHLEILPVAEAKSKVIPNRYKRLPPGDEVVSVVYPLRNTQAADALPTLQSFISPEGEIVVFEPTNTLFITDYASSMKRIRRMIRMLDRGEKDKTGQSGDGSDTEEDDSESACIASDSSPDEEAPWTPAEVNFALCGCAPNGEQTVYGFCPQGAEPVDLEETLFSRIGYSPFSFNEQSEFLDLLDRDDSLEQVLDDTTRDFLNSARRHKVKADLVITKNDWCDSKCDCEGACSVNMRYQLDRLVSSVNRLVRVPISGAYNEMIRDSSIGGALPTLGDGVTIKFECFPRDVCAVKLFEQMIKRVKNNLGAWEKKSKKTMRLNIAFDYSEIGKGAYSFSNLKTYIYEPEDSIDVRLLIGLGADTSAQKKQLRAKIESAYKGDVRRTVLRKIIPMLPFENVCKEDIDKNQIIDDLIYFHDNFGGAALPCLNAAKQDADPDIVSRIKEEFHQNENADAVKRWIMNAAPKLSGYVCALRWEIRIIANLLVFLQLVFTVLCVFSFKLRAVRKKHGKIFIGIALITCVLWFFLMLFDPFWTQYIMLVIIAAAVLTAVVFFLMTLSAQNRRNYP